MAKHRNYDHGDVFYASTVDALMEFVGISVENIRLTCPTNTTLRVSGSSSSSQASIGIDGLWRYRSTDYDLAISGGAGIKDIYAVAVTANSFSNSPSADTDLTDYNFELRAVASGGTPSSVAAYRKIAEVDWDGSKITGVRQLRGAEDVTLPMYPTSPSPAVPALVAKGAASQTADIAQVQQSDGTVVFKVAADGTVTVPTLSQVLLPANASPVIQTNQVAGNIVLQNKLLAADANTAFRISGDGKHEWGVGGATALDTNLYRSAVGFLKTDGGIFIGSSGLVGTPSLTLGSAGNGWYAPGSNQISLVTNGVARISVGSSGAITFDAAANGVAVTPTGNPTGGALVINPTISSATGNVSGLNLAPTFSGSGAAPRASQVGATFSPSSTITQAYNLMLAPSFSPGGGVTITNAYASNAQPTTTSAGGAIGTLYGYRAESPTYGSIKPTTSVGVSVADYGSASITTAIGVDIAAQSAAGTTIGLRIAASTGTTKYALQLSDTGGTTAGGVTFGTDTALYRAAGPTLTVNQPFAISTTSSPTFTVGGVSSANRFAQIDASGNTTLRNDNNAVTTSLTLINAGIAAADQGTNILFRLGSGNTPVDAGYVRLASSDSYALAANRDSYLAFGTSLDGTVGEVMRLTSGGTLQLSSVNNPTSYINVTGNNAATTDTAGLNFQPNYTGVGGGFGLRAIAVSGSWNIPSGTLSEGAGMRNRPTFNPTTGATISNSYAYYGQNLTGSAGGAISNIYGLYIDNASFGSVVPGTTHGVRIGQQGAASVTTAYGLRIDQQSGATTNYGIDMQISDPVGLRITGTATTNTASLAGISLTMTFSGQGTQNSAINASPTYSVAGVTISQARTFMSAATFNPGASGVITTAQAYASQIVTGSGAGAITNVIAFQAQAASYGTIKPTNAYGFQVGNQGSASITEAVGVDVLAQTAAATTIGVRVALPTGSTAYALQLSDATGVAAGGITFGTDVQMYRQGTRAILIKPVGGDPANTFQVQPSGSSTPTLHVSTSNNRVGIGIASPATTLDVAGPVNVSNGYLYGGNTVIGISSNILTLGSAAANSVGVNLTGTVGIATNPVAATGLLVTVPSANTSFAPTTGTVASALGVNTNPTFNPTNATITTAVGLQTAPVTGSGASGVITTLIGQLAASPTFGSAKPATVVGMSIQNQGSASVTTAIGLDVAGQSSAATNIGVRVALATTAALQFSDTGGTAAGGILFGTSGTANLYRSTTNTLTTDGALTVVGVLTAPTAAVDTNTTQVATTAYVVGQGYAKLASPTFTGTPAAPTAAIDTNTTQIATTAFVLAQAAAANPVALGSVAVGSSTRYARADHVHPTTGLAVLASANTFTDALTITPTTNPSSQTIISGTTTSTTNNGADLRIATIRNPGGAVTSIHGIELTPTFNATGATVTNYAGINLDLSTGSGASGVITNLFGTRHNASTFGSIVPANIWGTQINDQGNASATTVHGLEITSQTGPVNNTAALHLSGTTNSVKAGIQFRGLGNAANLYSDAGSSLTTDGSLTIGANLTMPSGTITVTNSGTSGIKVRSGAVGSISSLAIGRTSDELVIRVLNASGDSEITATNKLALNGTAFGVFGVTPQARPAAYTNSSGLTGSRTLPAGFTLNDLAKFVLQMLADDQGYGWKQ